MNAQRMLAGIGAFAVFVGTGLGIAAATQSPVGAADAPPSPGASASPAAGSAAAVGADGSAGITWRVSAVGPDGQDVTPVAGAGLVTLTLNQDGTYRGYDGTNGSAGGTYHIDGNQLTLDRVGIGAMIGTPDLAPQELAGRSLFGTNGNSPPGAMAFSLAQDPAPTLTIDTGAWVLVFHIDLTAAPSATPTGPLDAGVPAPSDVPTPSDTPPPSASLASGASPAPSASPTASPSLSDPAPSPSATSSASPTGSPTTSTTPAPSPSATSTGSPGGTSTASPGGTSTASPGGSESGADGPRASAKLASVAAGAVQTVTGSGFAPGELVSAVLHSDPLVIGMTSADTGGAVSFVWTIPSSAQPGQHSVTLMGMTSDGSAVVGFTITAATANPVPANSPPASAQPPADAAAGNLALTGASISPALMGSALACILTGLALLIIAARTRPTPRHLRAR
ncbi:MAG: META domain-containing protein [Frankiaceae bacterium]|jgi:heat shock protein HslJ|nr:META domain-containing protein [Frankiaceae bacterium]